MFLHHVDSANAIIAGVDGYIFYIVCVSPTVLKMAGVMMAATASAT